MTTLESMARAAYEKFPTVMRGPHFLGCLHWPELQDWQKKELCEAQRAALLEARTPSHEITAAVVKPGDDRSQAVLGFRAIVDAIIGEKP